MEQKRTRENLLKSLELNSFYDLTPEIMDKFLYKAKEMPAEELKTVLAEIPDFPKLMKESLDAFKSTGEKALAGNTESMRSFYALCNAMQKCLEEELKRAEDPNERVKILDMLMKILDKADKKDSENKEYLLSVMKAVGAGVGVGLVVVCLYGMHQGGLTDKSSD
ncbi:hypothetical protein [uncultured Selenomonas sp.]|uniref:hypothetical protein n=1 Tax=uncultured Selenomonas sp. TaxID=159275 RepID=UPI0028E3D162|nr:hypothetical protein [uncultured Selenomonas sp.]